MSTFTDEDIVESQVVEPYHTHSAALIELSKHVRESLVGKRQASEERAGILIPGWIWEKLPSRLRELCTYFAEGYERDVFLTAALTVSSGILSRAIFKHRDKWYHLNLFALVTAPAGSGKGDADWARRLGSEIDKRLYDQSRAEIAAWERQKKEIEDIERRNSRSGKNAVPEPVPELPSQPALRTLFVAVNSSARAVIDRLHCNDGEAILFDTETATFLSANKQDWGDSSEVYLKGFQNEPVSIDRRGGESLRINQPCFAAFLSGTPAATMRLLPSAEDGLFSRFLFYGYSAPPVWRSHEPSAQFDEREHKFNCAALWLDKLHHSLELRQDPLRLTLTPNQWKSIDGAFGGAMEALVQSGTDPLILASIKRAALAAERIGCILAILREHDNGTKLDSVTSLRPTDEDIECAIALASTYLSHAIELARTLREPAESKLTGKDLQFYTALPMGEFGTKERDAVASALGMNERTGRRRMEALIEKSVIQNPKNGLFVKMSGVQTVQSVQSP
jgi:hypothetical protein